MFVLTVLDIQKYKRSAKVAKKVVKNFLVHAINVAWVFGQ
jgi:hypothetical protein